MKKIFAAGFVAMMFFTACQDSGSSTIGTYEKDDAAAAADTKEDPVKEESMHSNSSTGGISADSVKNITGVRKDSVSSNNPTQAETAIEKKKVKVQKTKEIDKKL